ncbi:dihydrofolate reductase [Arsenicicoccus dermatophilus]|uniref:dihydrofolate reductase n=1 Tax=Arsenicicoccus dermatophilus TaxID=1076331 RepID=UPI001F4D0BCB|nr:dihydrofolate reductase [Arsenicicoccus dermatophilus]MCH8612864.1 dihydrofolate reductase [Arsenicicoccus dermatophilus]
MTNPGPPPASPVPGQTLTLVAAVGRNGALGRDGGLIWHLPGDLPRFKALTIGRPMIEGRRTYDAIGRALPGRRTIVVTRDDGWHRDDAETAGSIEQALALAGPGEVTCGGGGEIYALALPHADRLELTEVDDSPQADAFFPEVDPADWRETAREERPAGPDHPAFAFVTYERVRG